MHTSNGTSAPERLRMLVADDSPVYRKLLEQTLETENLSILFARSGGEAIELFTKHAPSIVLTDWMMPDISGIDICQKIRSEARSSYTYILLLTSFAEKENVVKGLQSGADDYLTKPFHPEELLARIGVGRRIIALHREIEIKNRLLEEAARTDSLTGMPNRRAIEEWAHRQIKGAARHGFAVWVVIIDLDKFKGINDSYGHGAGDDVLREFAAMLKKTTRASDICGRLGGEEFLLVVTHVEKSNLLFAIDRIRKKLELHEFQFAGSSVKVTASFGVAGFIGSAPPDFSALLKKADTALYLAKNRGRNRIEFAEE